MYASRAVLIALYLMLPRTELNFYVFAAGLGFTWLATVPPTAAIVGKLFGVRYLATLFGLTLLSHQIGGFLGAWLGGLAITRFGDFGWMWYADMALAALAALLNLPIREALGRALVDHPVAATGHALDAQVGHQFVEAFEQHGAQRGVGFAPDHQGRHAHRQRRRVERERGGAGVVGRRRIERRGAVEVERAVQRTGLRPGVAR
jgi:MFS family permease